MYRKGVPKKVKDPLIRAECVSFGTLSIPFPTFSHNGIKASAVINFKIYCETKYVLNSLLSQPGPPRPLHAVNLITMS